MKNIVIKVKVVLKVQGAAGVLCLLLGVCGVHHAQPYVFSNNI